MTKKTNNKNQPQRKKVVSTRSSTRIEIPRIVARQDETYRPVRQLNEAVNMKFEQAKGNASTPKQRTRITHAQENYNVKQQRQRQVTSRGYDHTRREKQQHKREDIERINRQHTVEQFSSNIPYSVTNSIENARRNQAQLWDKDKVDNARNMQNMVNRDFLVMPGYQSMISAYNPYTQSQEIGQTFSDATRLHGYVNAAQMATAAGMAPLKFGLSLGAMYAGNKLGDKAVDLGMKWFTPYNSWYDYANKKWGYNEQEAQRSNPGGWVLGGLGMFLGPKLANTKPFVPFEIWNESRQVPLSDEYITTFQESPKQLYAQEFTKPVSNSNPDVRYGGERPERNNYIWTYDQSNPHHITLHQNSKVIPNFRVSDIIKPKDINNGLTPEAEAELAKRANWQGDSFQLAKDRLANGGYERLSNTAQEVVNQGEGQLIYNNRTGEFIEVRPSNYYYADEFLGRDLDDMLNAKPEYMFSSDFSNRLTGENIAVSHTGGGRKHIIVFNDRPYEYQVSDQATSDLIGHEFEHYTHLPFEKLPEDVYRPQSRYYKKHGNTEVAARIGQIKAYYGLKEGEPLTGDHFRYAEKHFVKDRGYDNSMTTFFKGIVDYDKLAKWANRNVLGITVPLGIGLGISNQK